MNQRQLFDQYAPKILALCYRYTLDKQLAEDLCKETLVQFFLEHRFDSQEGEAYSIIRDKAIGIILAHYKEKGIELSKELKLPDIDWSRLSKEEFYDVLKGLSIDQRLYVNLVMIEQLDINDTT